MFVNKGCSIKNEVSKEVETRRRWEQSFHLGSQESREEKRGHKDILVKKMNILLDSITFCKGILKAG